MLTENKQCCTCREIKSKTSFYKDKNNKDLLYRACKECHNKRTSSWAKNNPNKVEENRIAYLSRHRVNSKKYRDNNKEKAFLWRQNNKDILRQKKNERRKNNINCRIADYLRSRVGKMIKGILKSGSAILDLGCTIPQLINHLESKFYANQETGEMMCWDNYGFYGWHIDHIIPLSAFNLADRQQFLKAVHYTNLQPLWMKENLSKNKYGVFKSK